jgi:hypothetical protein
MLAANPKTLQDTPLPAQKEQPHLHSMAARHPAASHEYEGKSYLMFADWLID